MTFSSHLHLCRFKVEWLTHGYSDEQKVKSDRKLGILSEKVAKALLGVHKRHQVLAKGPSTDDIELLKKVYGGKLITLRENDSNSNDNYIVLSFLFRT